MATKSVISKIELMQMLAQEVGIKVEDIEILYQELLFQIQEMMAAKQKLCFPNLGTFGTQKNPKTKTITPYLKVNPKIK